MNTLTLPKKKPPAKEQFKRAWHEHLSERQLADLVERFGNEVEDIATVQILVTFRGGQNHLLDVGRP